PTDRQHLAAQGDLAGHCDVATYGNTGEYRHQSGSDRDSGRRPILGNCAFRKVNVQVVLLVKVVLDTERARTLAHHRQRGLDRLLHDLAQLAGGHHLALAREGDRLDGQELAAYFGPGETRDLSDLVLHLRNAEAVLAHAQILVDVARVDHYPASALLENERLHDLAADLGNFTFHAANAGFARVVADDVAQRILGHGQL